LEADSTVNPGSDAGAESGAGEPTFALPPAFDLETAKQAAYDAVMAQADEPTEDGDGDPVASAAPAARETKPAAAAKAEAPDAAPDPLAKLSPEDRQAVEDHILSKFQAEQATLKDLQDRAAEAEKATATRRDRFSQWLAVDPAVKAEHDELRALVMADPAIDPEKWVKLANRGLDLDSAIKRVADLEGQIGERNERSAMSQAISEDERLLAWTEVNDAALSH
jgi:hypothetical protein